jgi:hypothetical protein
MVRSFWFIAIILVLASCTSPQTTPTATSDPQQIMTAVQLTVEYSLTQMMALTPSATATATMTETPLPTTPEATTPSVTETLSKSATATKASLADKAELTAQSVADNSQFTPGAPFKVTWTFTNIGKTTWTTDYSAKFWSDSLMGAPAEYKFPKEVKPGESIDITMSFTAPTNIGSAKSSWWLQNADGVNFYPFFVAIEVTSALPTPPTPTFTQEPSPTSTPTPTATTTTSP